MQRINEDIKSGNFRQMYLLYGEEAYLRKQYRDRLKKAMISDDDTMNYSYLEGKDISSELIELEQLGQQYGVTLILSISLDAQDLPEHAQSKVIVSL